MNFRAINIALVVAIIASLALAYYTTNTAVPDWGLAYLGSLGSYLSVVAIIYNLYQVYQIREETALIQKATLATQQRITRLEHFGDLAQGIKLAQEIQTSNRASKHEMSVARLQELKITIGEIKATAPVSSHAAQLDATMLTLNLHISYIEKEIEQKRKSLSFASMNGELDKIMDFLVILKTHIAQNSP